MRPNYPPSLRVASKCGACGVALLAKGATLGFVARLAVIRIWRQRVSCVECQQTLGYLAPLPGPLRYLKKSEFGSNTITSLRSLKLER